MVQIPKSIIAEEHEHLIKTLQHPEKKKRLQAELRKQTLEYKKYKK